MFIALTQVAASVYQMMRGFIVVITAGMAVVFLGRKQYRHHWLSLLTIIIGIAIVGLASILHTDDSTDDSGDDDAQKKSSTSVFGVVLLLVAQCFTGCQFVSEEKLLDVYYIDPLMMVGFEGMWGCIYYAIVLPIL